MANWMKLVLGVVLSLGIGGGVAAFVYDVHPMRPYYSMSNERCPEERGPGSGIDCYDDYDRIMRNADGQDRWVAGASGVGAVLLFWLLVNWFYIRPKRRREQDEQA